MTMKIKCDVCLKSMLPNAHGNSATTCDSCRELNWDVRMVTAAINRLTACSPRRELTGRV